MLKLRSFLARSLNPIVVPLENRLFELHARCAPARFVQRLQRAIDRGINWFSAQPDWEFDACWLLGKVVDESFDARLAVARQRYAKYRREWRDPYLRLFDREYREEVQGAHAGKVPWRPEPIHALMRKVVNFDRLGLDERFIDELLELEDGGFYGSTHVVVGAHVLGQFSGLRRTVLDHAIDRTLPAIVNAQRSARVGDIFSERVLVLQLAGRDQLVRPAWICRIVAGQRADGSWRYRGTPPSAFASPQHPSALALAALIRYRRQSHDLQTRPRGRDGQIDGPLRSRTPVRP